MKKIIAVVIGIKVMALIVFAVLVYRWTITPFGRLHPIMAILHRLLTFVTNTGKFDRHDLPKVRQLMRLAKPIVPLAKVVDRTIALPGRNIPVRIYRPEGQGPFPVIVYYHGGGFMIGCVESHENLCRSLAKSSSTIVVSVGYRLAPEYPYPAAMDDAFGAVQWVQANAAEFEGDPDRIAVAGDSAGGNLAAAVCLRARDEKGPLIRLQILIYPVVYLGDIELPSRHNFKGYIITEESGSHILNGYIPDPKDRNSPYASPLLAPDHSDLPPAYIMTAAFDPLLDEGRFYADRLEEAGVPVIYHKVDGMVHGFMSYKDLVSFFPPLIHLLKQTDQIFAEIAAAVRTWL
ncbi:MAG: alpha/beta hydrolase [Candidatus Promineifilaceae bacterium]